MNRNISVLLALFSPLALAQSATETTELVWRGDHAVEVKTVMRGLELIDKTETALYNDAFAVDITMQDGSVSRFTPNITSLDDARNWREARTLDVDMDGDLDILVKMRDQGALLPYIMVNEGDAGFSLQIDSVQVAANK